MSGGRAVSMSDDGHVAWIAAKLGDVLRHPVKSGDLVHETVVAATVAVDGRGQEA